MLLRTRCAILFIAVTWKVHKSLKVNTFLSRSQRAFKVTQFFSHNSRPQRLSRNASGVFLFLKTFARLLDRDGSSVLAWPPAISQSPNFQTVIINKWLVIINYKIFVWGVSVAGRKLNNNVLSEDATILLCCLPTTSPCHPPPALLAPCSVVLHTYIHTYRLCVEVYDIATGMSTLALGGQLAGVRDAGQEVPVG